MMHYAMPARSQGELYAQRATARLAEKDVHRWVFAHSLAPKVECAVRKWLLQRLNVVYCELQLMYTPHVRSTSLARTHIVLNNTPFFTSSMARNDEAVEVNARGLNARDAVKALIKATGLNPHMSVCGWPFCLSDLDDANAEGGAA
jgi:hypothetical protein